MNKIISITCFKGLVCTAYTNKKNEPSTIKTDTVKEMQKRDPEPLEDLMDYMYANPFKVLFSGIFNKKK